MDLIETEFLSNITNDFKDKLDDEFFFEFINKSTDKLKSCLDFIKKFKNEENYHQNGLYQSLEGYFSLAVCSLQLFILTNWIYIKKLDLNPSTVNLLKEVDLEDLKKELHLLNSDYQPAIKYPELLYLTKQILKHCQNDNLCFLVWKLRYLTVFQSILNRTDNSFYDGEKELASLIIEKLESSGVNLKLKMRLLLEICQYNLVQNKVQDLRELLVNVSRCTQLDIKLSGALGKRTHFQTQAKSILFLNLTRKLNENESEGQSANQSTDKLNKNQVDVPKDMNLNDDTLLSKPVFLNENETNIKIELSDDEETLLLAIVKLRSKCGLNQDNLLKEELLVYLEYLISNSTVWSVTFESMYQRSIIESNERRKVERSMLQLNELIEKINDNKLIKGHSKLHLFYSTLITPIWKVKRKLADILISLSCVKEALEIYVELKLWEEIVFCYKQIDRRDKAAEIIREQLAIKETPYLLCLLGDATDQIELYEKAWQLSEGKSYLAQKRLGYHYFDLKDYQKAIECFKKSLELNCMQLDTLQRLGYSALLLEDYELAAQAYRRVVESNLDNYQAWNNLSKAYIKLKDKNRAFRTLQEALKCNYENWKIWENYIVVCIDVGALNDVIYSWNRLIDIKSKYEDDKIMEILIEQLCNDSQINLPNLQTLQKSTLQLLGRMTANFQCSSTLWLLYAKLLLHLNDNQEKIFNCLAKAQRALMSKSDWEKNSEDVLNNLKSLNLIYDFYKQMLEKQEIAEDVHKRHFTSFKLSSNSMILLIKNKSEYWSTGDGEIKQEIENCINDLVIKLNL